MLLRSFLILIPLVAALRRTTSRGRSSSCTVDKSAYATRISNLLREREGWGKDTVGGEDGSVFVVNTTDDSSSGCTLRAALTSSEKYWIVFDLGMTGKTIKLTSEIELQSYKTIDGLNSGITIQPPPETNVNKNCTVNTAFVVLNQKHLIINDLTFDGTYAGWDQDGECADAIYVRNSTYLWVHHNLFKNWPDEAVQIRLIDKQLDTISDYVTMTANVVTEIYQGFSLNSRRITFGRNVCDKIRRRCIKASQGWAHYYNNVVKDWADTSVLNVIFGQIYSQQNVFVPGDYNRLNKFTSEGDGSDRGIEHDTDHEVGDVEFVGFDGGVSRRRGSGGRVSQSFQSDSKSKVHVQECSSGDDGCVSALRASVESNAGPRGGPGLPSGEIMLKSVRSGRRLHVLEDARDGDAVVQQTSSSDGSCWLVENAGGGVMLKSKRSGGYLHVMEQNTGNEDPVFQKASTSEGSIWLLEPTDGGSVMLKSLRSGYYIHVKEQNTGDEDPVFQKASTSEGSQWQIEQ